MYIELFYSFELIFNILHSKPNIGMRVANKYYEDVMTYETYKRIYIKEEF